MNIINLCAAVDAESMVAAVSVPFMCLLFLVRKFCPLSIHLSCAQDNGLGLRISCLYIYPADTRQHTQTEQICRGVSQRLHNPFSLFPQHPTLLPNSQTAYVLAVLAAVAPARQLRVCFCHVLQVQSRARTVCSSVFFVRVPFSHRNNLGPIVDDKTVRCTSMLQARVGVISRLLFLSSVYCFHTLS